MQHDSRHCQQEHGNLLPEAQLTLKLGRQTTGGAKMGYSLSGAKIPDLFHFA
jgi:hypothetical protein